MLDYSEYPCDYCGEHAVIYHQYVGDAYCETCGKWELEDKEEESE